MGANVYVNGSCVAGFEPTNPSLPPQRLCPSTGTYTSTLRNPCIRTCIQCCLTHVSARVLTCAWGRRRFHLTETNCSAETNYNADWSKTAAGSTAVGSCGAGFADGAPQRVCQLDGTWSSTVLYPCQRMVLSGRPGVVFPPRTTTRSRLRSSSRHVPPRPASATRSPAGLCMMSGSVALVCAALASYSGATYNSTTAGSTVTGECLPGYSEGADAPTLECLETGVWAATATNPCTRTRFCG